MESDSTHGQTTATGSSGDSDWEQQQSGDEPGSSEQESETESDEERQQGRRVQGQCLQRPAAAGSAHAPAAATPAGEHGAGEALHAPFSHLLWCDTVFRQKDHRIASSLCTDIAGVSSSSGSGTAAVQVTVEVHAASWDVRQYILSQLQQHAPIAGQQRGRQSVQAGSSTPSPKVFGPYAATLTKTKNNSLNITQLQHQHEPQTYLQHLAGKPHCVVLQERVPGSDPPHFKMHVKPGTPEQSKNKDGQAISRAGEGPGLQVAPGSVSEVSNPGHVGRASSRATSRLSINIPKVLVCSQLPAGTNYPLDISLRVLPPPDGQQGQWTTRMCWDGKRCWSVRLNAAHPLSVYAGRSISKMSLSQDKQLILTFAPAAPAAMAPSHAPMPSPPPQQHQSRRPLKRRAAGGTGQQQAVVAGQGSGSGQSMPIAAAAAAAAAGDTSGQTAAAVTRKKPRRTNQQQRQAAAAAATAVPAFEGSDSQAAKAQRAAWRAAKAAAAGEELNQQQQEVPAETPGPAAAPEHPAALVPIKQEPDSSTPAPAAADTGLMFWHMGELSSDSSSGDEGEDDSLGGDTQPAADNLPGVPADQEPPAAIDSAAADPGPAPAIAASTQHASIGADTATTAAAVAAGPSSQQAVWFAGEPQQQPGGDLEHDGMGEAEEPAAATPPALAAAPTPAPEAPVPAVAPASLPAGLQLPPASTPAEIEAQLVGLMADSLMPLLDPLEYYGIMQQLSELFAPDRVVDAVKLRCRYAYVQAAVGAGQLDMVVKELKALVRAC